eukprot:CAMPEP_0172531726 /NCGR_PEP_ID=MMETSP1067-20121228/5006_1 /TAXON_ID=265564 ORGANISM="Thalassiosira punctigera, Strain Tpunct2005C2" /NCGR_SAMPLE_ID=MMETSP1067 /ASSEMBLY_ACC=CAM_ASM_000444 /LENGTH=299 /DNA_ID=CAMNT_0013316129 /DNA_START=182 /DNA_END=1081 /DNA_ORIENTATION=+
MAQSNTDDASHPAAGGDDDDGIKTMKLYTNVERIRNELEVRGMTDDDGEPIDPIALSEIDSMHYMGNAAVDEAIKAMDNLGPSSRILDVGSGFGGPARVLSARTKCGVTALELQEDIHEMAEYLTKRCARDDSVKHQQGDILSLDLDALGGGPGSFDGIVSFLVFLHIPQKGELLGRCARMLKPGGTIFVEDYFQISPFSAAEAESLSEDVFSKELPTREEYVSHLEGAGFRKIRFLDKTAEWTDYVSGRAKSFVADRDDFVKVHGEPTYASLLHFYEAVEALFAGGNLGGVRIVAEKR